MSSKVISFPGKTTLVSEQGRSVDPSKSTTQSTFADNIDYVASYWIGQGSVWKVLLSKSFHAPSCFLSPLFMPVNSNIFFYHNHMSVSDFIKINKLPRLIAKNKQTHFVFTIVKTREFVLKIIGNE